MAKENKGGCGRGCLGCFGVLLLGVIAFFVIGLFLPAGWDVSRTITIDAPAERVHAHVSKLSDWPNWTTWNTTKYPSLKYSYEGPESGVGAISTWTEDQMGGGRLEITESDPKKGISYVMQFEGYDSTMEGSINYISDGEQTAVTWSGNGELGNNPMMRWMGLMFNSQIGKDYDTGLENLKTLVESEQADSPPVAAPDEPTPDEPTPDEPAPDEPAPDEPAPADPDPAEPAPEDSSTPADPATVDSVSIEDDSDSTAP